MSLREFLPLIITIVTITLSWASINANNDKNNALMNQKLDQLIQNQTQTASQISLLSTDIVNLKIEQGGHEIRITSLEKQAMPLLSRGN